jgi:HD-like signal output (HDOD) protein
MDSSEHARQVAAADSFLESTHLPSRTAIVRDVLREMNSPEPSFEAVLARIDTDKPLAQRLVSLANSAWFGSAVKVDTAASAFSRMGLERFSNVTICSVARQSMHEVSDTLWPHLEFTAQFCETLAEHILPGLAGNAYWTGLFHDYAIPFMARGLTDYSYWTANATGFDAGVIAAERECYGFDHAVAAARLVRGWGFSGDVADAIENHHRSEHLALGLTHDAAQLLAMLVIAERIAVAARQQGGKSGELTVDPLLLHEAATVLGLKPLELQHQVSETCTRVAVRAVKG